MIETRTKQLDRIGIASSTTVAFATALAVTLISPGTCEADTTRFLIESEADFERVERRLAESQAPLVEIGIAAGTYTLDKAFCIRRSGVAVRGAGEEETILRLASGVQEPVISVGSDREHPDESDVIFDILISDLQIDGNRYAQPDEYHRHLPWIRNNGIDARAVSRLVVERVTSSNNRSGGLVLSWGCSDVLVRNSRFSMNHYDGVAYYQSSRVVTVDTIMDANDGAGASLDNGFVDSIFVRCLFEGNGDVGVFARDSARLLFEHCAIRSSAGWGFFLSHDENERGVFDVVVANCELDGNHGGVRFGSAKAWQSAGNRIYRTRFSDNDLQGRSDVSAVGAEPIEHVDPTGEKDRPMYASEDGFSPQAQPEEVLREALAALGRINGD